MRSFQAGEKGTPSMTIVATARRDRTTGVPNLRTLNRMLTVEPVSDSGTGDCPAGLSAAGSVCKDPQQYKNPIRIE
jgi:hypothetical protein